MLNKKSIISNAEDIIMDGWKHLLVKESTHDRIKQEAETKGMKMYALVDNAFPEKDD